MTEIRARRAFRLDVDRLANAIDIDLRYDNLGATLLGLTLNERQVRLNRSLRGAQLQLVFAHELAHILRRRGYFCEIPLADEEWFADWFARELVMPRRWLLRPWTGSLLAALHVDLETVALQNAVINRCPPLMRNGRRVLCRTCGTSWHVSDCPCRTWRHRDYALDALPDVRKLGLLSHSLPRDHTWLAIDTQPDAFGVSA